MSRRSPRTIPCKGSGLPSFVSDAIDEIGGLDKLTSAIPDEVTIRDQVKVYRALSNETRLTMLWSISCCDMCPCVLKEYLNVSDSTISYHLEVLEKAGLISGRPQRNWRIFAITDKGRKALTGWTKSQSSKCVKK